MVAILSDAWQRDGHVLPICRLLLVRQGARNVATATNCKRRFRAPEARPRVCVWECECGNVSGIEWRPVEPGARKASRGACSTTTKNCERVAVSMAAIR